ncbi:hypothetical protein YH63_013980 [Afipia massiliensis]|uniref:Uncharacterized protein n=1 Tax=Afipia massiliensis TaxID=211460 RepID=A0A4U6BTN6_9BRAD|nr:hypothetical protein [Afipia massiliensis]TKT72448.1 hypothetical protein YH63_013980 [Afipia massiliensis]
MLSQMFNAGRAGPETASDGTQYIFKPSLVGGAAQFDLTDDGLSWQVRGKQGVWPLEKIAAIRLSYRPVSMQSRRFRADIEDTRGERVTIYSTTWHTVALMSPQDNGYRAFIVELHRRLAAAGSNAVLIIGINPTIYLGGLFVVALVGVAMLGLLIRALITGEFGGALFLLGFAALFGWQIGNFMRRNRPRGYTFEALPKEVLP